MRSYLRISPQLVQEKEKDGYPPAAGWAYVALLCEGASQNPAGRFKNLTVLRGHLGQHARWIRLMLDQHDLEILPDGTYYIARWDEWQEGNWQVAERMKRVRESRANRNASDASDRNGSDAPDRNGATKPVTKRLSTLTSSLALSAPQTNSFPKPSAEATVLLGALEQVTLKPPSRTDRLKADELVTEFANRLTPEHMADRIRGHAGWCQQHAKPVPTTMSGFRDSLRREHDHEADLGHRVRERDPDDQPEPDPDDVSVAARVL